MSFVIWQTKCEQASTQDSALSISLNKLYSPFLNKTQHFNNIDAFNPGTKSCYCHGRNIAMGPKQFRSTKTICQLYSKERWTVFSRPFTSHLVLDSAGTENYIGRRMFSSFTPTPHRIQEMVSFKVLTKFPINVHQKLTTIYSPYILMDWLVNILKT